MADKFLFEGTRVPKNLTKYNLYRGVTDFGSLDQFNIFESGHAFMKVLQIPEFLKKLSDKNDAYKHIIANAVHAMEYEFKGLDGIEDMTANTQEITDGVNSINVINGVKKQSASTVSMRYMEKTGSLFTKFTELYLAGIYDPRSTFKHYHGLIDGTDNGMVDGYEKEVFTLLYWITDATGYRIEKAYMLIGGQIIKSDQSIYNSTKGEHDGKEITIEMNCFPADAPQVTELAEKMLTDMQIVRNNANANYTYKQNYSNVNIAKNTNA